MISAIILAAGQSKRMGEPKMLLPWGNVSVLEQVIAVFASAGLEDILVVTGAKRRRVEAVLERCRPQYPVRSVFNAAFETDEMIASVQCGLKHFDQEQAVGAALIGLGDQPQVEEGSVRAVCEAFQQTRSPLIVPSHQMRRGHPWLVARDLWPDVLALTAGQTPRDFLNAHAARIHYVEVSTPSILADLDTPAAYHAARPK